MTAGKSSFPAGKKIDPKPIHSSTSVAEPVDNNFISYNAGRLREACQLFTERILQDDVTIQCQRSTHARRSGISAIIPLIESGFVDWIVSTGANLYHDTPNVSDVRLREKGISLPK